MANKRSIFSEALAVSEGNMTQDLAKQLFARGAVLLLLDLPRGSQFGIDCSAWGTGPEFKGLKMIPPGVHFVYFSAVSNEGAAPPRIGFWHHFEETELMVRKWDKLAEDLSEVELTDEEVEQYRSNLQDLDRSLGPYPYDSYRSWFSLSGHVTELLIDRLSPLSCNGRISSQCDLISKESLDKDACNSVDKEHPVRTRYTDAEGLPVMLEVPGTEIRFTKIRGRELTAESTAAERTQAGMDGSDRLQKLIDSCQSEAGVLGEIQFAFLCFMLGQVYHAFEHWKRLISVVCSCESALVTRGNFYEKLINVLYFQLKEVPEDFFVDIVTKDNFLAITLGNFFSMIDISDDVGESVKLKAGKFRRHLESKFGWDFSQDADEYRPVIVGEDGY